MEPIRATNRPGSKRLSFLFYPDQLSKPQITLVAHVVDVDEYGTHFLYKLEDGSGRLEVRRWKEEIYEDDLQKWPEVKSVNRSILS